VLDGEPTDSAGEIQRESVERVARIEGRFEPNPGELRRIRRIVGRVEEVDDFILFSPLDQLLEVGVSPRRANRETLLSKVPDIASV
jgi:hypothetical protein